MTRLGKIARLPLAVREELSRHLQDGEQAKQLVVWLNSLPAVQRVLAEQFGGRAINEQNLSDWKQGGHEDWLRHQESCDQARLLCERSRQLRAEAGGEPLEELLAPQVGLALAATLRHLQLSEADPKNVQALLNLTRELSRLRRSTHDAECLRIEQERWSAEKADREAAERRQEQAQIHREMFRARFPRLTAEAILQPYAAFRNEFHDFVVRDEVLRREEQKAKENGDVPNDPKPGESNRIKSDQAESNL